MKISNNMSIAACLLAAAIPVDVAIAQTETTANPLERSRPLRPGPPRYIEQYRFLSDPTKRTDFFDPIRYIELGESSWIQFGGGIRYKYDSWDNPAFGLRGLDEDNYLQQRIQAHADLHLFDGALRSFLQLEDTQSWDKEAFSPYDESNTEIRQAFADVAIPANSNGKLIARLGRQEMAYGEQVLTTVREVPNVRLSFDGVRLMYKNSKGYNLNVFAVRPVANVRQGSFNDSSTDSGDFYGLYATLPVNEGLNLDLYEMSYLRDSRTLHGVNGEEDRHTIGARLFGSISSFDYTADLMYQFGEFAEQDIRAWGLSSSAGYTFDEIKWKPGIALRLDAASGDENTSDNETNTFDPLFPANGKLYGNISASTLSNIIMIGPRVAFSPVKNITIATTAQAFWRESEDDVAYMPGMNAIPGTGNVSSKRLGTSYNLFARWTPTANLTVDLEHQYYDVDDVIREAGGESMTYTSIRTSFLF